MKKAMLHATALAIAASLAAGCASRLPADQPVYVYVADNSVVTFRGEPLKAGDLPERLLKAGATPQTHIYIVAQGDVPSAFLTQLAVDCGRAGLPDCTIRERKRITIEKGTVVHSFEAEAHDEHPSVNIRHSEQ